MEWEMIPTLAIDAGILKKVACLAWEKSPNPIICVGASLSYPFLCVSLCTPFVNNREYMYLCSPVVMSGKVTTADSDCVAHP